ncbi:MAG: FixH family protein [Rhodospirillales bacterium]
MQTSPWRFFPWFIAAGMTVVIAVNVGMVTTALHTFPGKTRGGEGFDLSNRYNTVLDRMQTQAALGWTVDAATDSRGRPVLRLAGAGHAPLNRARIVATASRPVGEAMETSIVFYETMPGQYAGDITLPAQGQWELLLTIAADGHEVAATRRIVVK